MYLLIIEFGYALVGFLVLIGLIVLIGYIYNKIEWWLCQRKEKRNRIKTFNILDNLDDEWVEYVLGKLENKHIEYLFDKLDKKVIENYLRKKKIQSL